MLTLTLMQAESGKGKSFHAKRLAVETGAAIVSTDDYPGLYAKRPDGTVAINLPLRSNAFGACFRDTIELLREGRSVIVDNTNTCLEEIAPFIAFALAYGARVTIVRVTSNVKRKNTHGVPAEAIKAQTERLAAFTPPSHWQYVPVSYVTVAND
jgi:predicted kinase